MTDNAVGESLSRGGIETKLENIQRLAGAVWLIGKLVSIDNEEYVAARPVGIRWTRRRPT